MLQAGNWVTVLGPRMVGKTSLIKAANKKLGSKYRTVYVDLWGVRGIQGLLGALVNEVNSSRDLSEKFKDFASRIDGLSIGPGGISIESPRRPLTSVWDLINTIAKEAGKNKVIIELDEVVLPLLAEGKQKDAGRRLCLLEISTFLPGEASQARSTGRPSRLNLGKTPPSAADVFEQANS